MRSSYLTSIFSNISLTLKNIIAFIFLTLSLNTSAQQTPKLFTGPYRIGINDGTATYTYFEQNGERIIDGNFSFSCPIEKITINGKYDKGKKTGLWTRKQLHSTYSGMPAVKAELKWNRVTENTPLKEITEINTENYLIDKLEGICTNTKTVKNSWGYPAPGGTSSSVFIVKKIFASGEMTSIEATRKKNDKVNLSFKGAYKRNLVDGNWLFNDNKNIYSYTFLNGYLSNYEIKEIGTGKLIEGNKIEVDNDLINSYFSKSDNNFEIEYEQFNSELRDAKISIQKVNENLSIIKLCKLKKEAANFINLDVRLFSNAFGEDVTPYKNDYNEFGYSPNISCEVLSENNYRLLDKVYFKDVKSEYSFLNLTTNLNGQFLNTDWKSISNFSNSRYFFQLKSYLYKGDTSALKAFLEIIKRFDFKFETYPIPYGKHINIGKSELEYNEYLKFLISLSLGETENWKAFIDKTYNSSASAKSWQSAILNQLTEIQSSTSFIKENINDVISYLNSKEKEVQQLNIAAIANIKEIKIGNQIWMGSDLNFIPSHQSYQIIIGNKMQDRKVGNGLLLYGLNNDNKGLCPNGWRMPTIVDWENLIKTLGGDKKTAGDLLLVRKGSGFETTFPIIYQTDDYGIKLKFSSGSLGGYLALDSNGNITSIKFGYESQLTYYTNTSFVPCRCIKE